MADLRPVDSCVSESSDGPGMRHPSSELLERTRRQLQHIIDGYRSGLAAYESLAVLNEVIGTQYGNRVLFELIQNAHDAHSTADGEIAIELAVENDNCATLYVANRGHGFSRENVISLQNIGLSSKRVGEGIGNKGLGFRSVDALTAEVEIYSQEAARPVPSFTGYCFRFASRSEVLTLLAELGVDRDDREAIARTVPRYLAALPLYDQDPDIAQFAQRGFATVIKLPLRTATAVNIARTQIEELAESEAPLLLFLSRIGAVTLHIRERSSTALFQRLTRREISVARPRQLNGGQITRVELDGCRAFLNVTMPVDKKRVLAAVGESIDAAPSLARWLDWRGDPVVAVAVPWEPREIAAPRLYNFLPMGDISRAPINGFLDAPFFADIDRRAADLSLPLNELLVTAVAEACAAAAMHIISDGANLSTVSPHAVVDLVAWDDNCASILDHAFQQMEMTLANATVWPIAGESKGIGWERLSAINAWADEGFSVFRIDRFKRCRHARLLLPALGNARLSRVRALARRIGRNGLLPSSKQLATWIEEVAHQLVADKRTRNTTWAAFYSELRPALQVVRADLTALRGHNVLLDNGGKLRPAVAVASRGERPVYYRPRESQGSRGSRPPAPPKSLRRRFRFLNERLVLAGDVLAALEAAALVHRYNPIEALTSLDSALGERPSDVRRAEAIHWAFRVWRFASSAAEEALGRCNLHVKTNGGWLAANRCAFSATWTTLGKTLESYLIETRELSEDCSAAWNSLLVPFSEWLNYVGDGSKTDWIRFLQLLGAEDGLVPCRAYVSSSGTPSAYWHFTLRRVSRTFGLPAYNASFSYPYTTYTLQDSIAYVPGQLEFQALPDTAKEKLCVLLLAMLREHGERYLWFSLGRFERMPNVQDVLVLPTPLATFLKTAAWVSCLSSQRTTFQSPRDIWATRARRHSPPRFVWHLPAQISADLLEDDALAKVGFSQVVGFRDWGSPDFAAERLKVLAEVFPVITFGERREFRSEYSRAWRDFAGLRDRRLIPETGVVVRKRGGEEVVFGTAEEPTEIVVSEGGRRFETRLLIDAGRAVLDVDDADIDTIAKALAATATFYPRRVDELGIELRVDGAPYTPTGDEPRLVTLAPWLPDFLALTHSLLADRYEKGIPATLLDTRCRALRFRRCRSLSLTVDGVDVSDNHGVYGYASPRLPTVILQSDGEFDLKALLRLSATASRLIDSRLRSLETALLRLHVEREDDAISEPTEDEYARVFCCDVESIREYFAATRGSSARLLTLITPAVAYLGGVDLALQLQQAAERSDGHFDILAWLLENISDKSMASTLHQRALECATPADLRRVLAFDIGAYNDALASLGLPYIADADELRRAFAAYLAEMKGLILDKLRRYYLPAYRAGQPLDDYLRLKSLEFVGFKTEWLRSVEVLDRELVAAYVAEVLDKIVPFSHAENSIAPLADVLEPNRRVAQSAIKDALPVVLTWCAKRRIDVPEEWRRGDIQTITSAIENSGRLDFLPVTSGDIPVLCDSLGLWPQTMPASIALSELGLTESDVEQESALMSRMREKEAELDRSIVFAGTRLDPQDAAFAYGLREAAESAMAEDNSWLTRSARVRRLRVFEPADPSRPSPRSHRTHASGRRPFRPTEELRMAMGLAGELLAFAYLQRLHVDHFTEECWVSSSRARYYGGFPGDDSLGYDFRVQLANRDLLYEVKSSLDDSGEFEITDTEMLVAQSASRGRRKIYRVLYVPYVFDPERWRVLVLPNPMDPLYRKFYRTIARGALRLRFERI